MSTSLSYCPTCRTCRPTVVASSDLERGAHDVTCWDACSVCKTPVNPPVSGGFEAARGILPFQPGDELPEVRIRRMRDAGLPRYWDDEEGQP